MPTATPTPRPTPSIRGVKEHSRVTVQVLPRLFPDRKMGGGACYDATTDTIIFVGGSDSFPNRIYEIDPDTWHVTILDAVTPVHGLAAYGCTPKVIYIGGGARGDWDSEPPGSRESNPTEAIHRFDLIDRTIAEIPDVALVEPIVDTSGVWHQAASVFLVFGGAAGSGEPGVGSQYRDGIQAYDPIRGTVETIGQLPHNGDECGTAYDPDREVAYVVGCHAEGVFYTDIIEVQPTGYAQIVGQIPVGLDNMAVVYAYGYVYIIGGRAHHCDPTVDADCPEDRGLGVSTIYRWDPDFGGEAELLPERLAHQTWATAYAVRRTGRVTELFILTDSRIGSQMVVLDSNDTGESS